MIEYAVLAVKTSIFTKFILIYFIIFFFWPVFFVYLISYKRGFRSNF